MGAAHQPRQCEQHGAGGGRPAGPGLQEAPAIERGREEHQAVVAMEAAAGGVLAADLGHQLAEALAALHLQGWTGARQIEEFMDQPLGQKPQHGPDQCPHPQLAPAAWLAGEP